MRISAALHAWVSLMMPDMGIDKRALILLNTPQDKDLVTATWNRAAIKICADGASDVLRSLHPDYVPTVVVGDMDSSSPEVRAHYRSLGCEVLEVG